jgi:integrase
LISKVSGRHWLDAFLFFALHFCYHLPKITKRIGKMAAPKKEGSVWRHRIMVKGKRVSGTFPTKAAALAWEAEQRIEIIEGTSSGTGKTLRDALRRYELEVSKKKRSYVNEARRLAVLCETEMADKKIAEIRPSDIAAWRDKRLETVVGSTVNRDLNLLSHVFTVARREWGWIEKSPTTDVRRPPDPPSRDRLYSQKEIDYLCAMMGITEHWNEPVETVTQRVGVAFLFAIETAMRLGEICSLRPQDIKGRVARLGMTKNGTKRDVPLSSRAVQLLKLLPPREGFDTVFGMTPKVLDLLFRKARVRAGIVGGTFHDTRHLAITRLAKKLHVLDLARMTGHRDLKKLQIYYNESADDIASRLD